MNCTVSYLSLEFGLIYTKSDIDYIDVTNSEEQCCIIFDNLRNMSLKSLDNYMKLGDKLYLKICAVKSIRIFMVVKIKHAGKR